MKGTCTPVLEGGSGGTDDGGGLPKGAPESGDCVRAGGAGGLGAIPGGWWAGPVALALAGGNGGGAVGEG